MERGHIASIPKRLHWGNSAGTCCSLAGTERSRIFPELGIHPRGILRWSRLDSIHPQMNVEICATMRASVCYRIALLGEEYETCCSICKFENRKEHQH